MKHWKDEDGEMRGEGLIGEGLRDKVREECGRGCGEHNHNVSIRWKVDQKIWWNSTEVKGVASFPVPRPAFHHLRGAHDCSIAMVNLHRPTHEYSHMLWQSTSSSLQ